MFMIYSTLPYPTLLYSTLPYPTLLYSTLLYSTPLYSLLYPTLLYCTTLLYTTLLYNTLLYSALPYSTPDTCAKRCSSKKFTLLVHYFLKDMSYAEKYILYSTLPYATLPHMRPTPLYSNQHYDDIKIYVVHTICHIWFDIYIYIYNIYCNSYTYVYIERYRYIICYEEGSRFWSPLWRRNRNEARIVPVGPSHASEPSPFGRNK